jgi:hypothetical protein
MRVLYSLFRALSSIILISFSNILVSPRDLLLACYSFSKNWCSWKDSNLHTFCVLLLRLWVLARALCYLTRRVFKLTCSTSAHWPTVICTGVFQPVHLPGCFNYKIGRAGKIRTCVVPILATDSCKQLARSHLLVKEYLPLMST